MDIKSKGKSWAGNIYHQFESICQDVDGFMSKDTVKFVENQVQSVGVSVKRFYSNVVQDILPVSENTVSTKALKHVNSVTDAIKDSVTDAIKEPTNVIEKQLSVNEGSILRNSYTLFSDELSHALKLTTLFNADPSQVSKNVVVNDSNHSFEEKSNLESMAPSGEPSWENDIYCELLDENHKNSPANNGSSSAISDGTECPVTGSTIECTFGSQLLTDNLEVEKGLSVIDSPLHSSIDTVDGTLLISDVSGSLSTQSITPAKCDGILDVNLSAKDETASDSPLHSSSDPASVDLLDSDENRSVSAQSMTSAKCDRTLHDSFSSRAESIPDFPLHFSSDLAHMPLEDFDESRSVSARSVSSAKNDGVLHDSYSSKAETIPDFPLHFSSDLENVPLVDPDETRSVSAQSITLAKYDGTPHDSFSTELETNSDMSNSFQSPELFFPYSINEEGTNVMPSISSTSLESSIASESVSADFVKKVESGLISRVECSGYESNTVDVCPTTFITEANVGLSESRRDREQLHEIGESKHSISSSRIGRAGKFDFGDLNMETIDLSSNEKLDRDIVIFNNSFTQLASHRRKSFKYYKKLIHRAFTSRKRVSKEYEHLPILYGDIDKELSQNFRTSSVPSSPKQFFHALPEETRDTEWELL